MTYATQHAEGNLLHMEYECGCENIVDEFGSEQRHRCMEHSQPLSSTRNDQRALVGGEA